ncbi:peptidase [Agrobacterium tumefaciens]|nr:peptidase [Agrobacterium tumefaciens]
MKPFEIFRTGTHTTAKGQTLTFAETDVADIVASYDPALHHAPIVIGHPKQDGPAYGWIKSLEVKDGRIVAVPEQVDATFSEMVRAGQFSKRSAGLYHPTQTGNPTPGKYHLRHVGFLGAEPPAIKGLKPVEFAEGELAIELEFSEYRTAWAFDNVASLFRRIRDFIIETRDVETADKIVPPWDLDQIAQTAADIRADGRVEEVRPHFSETEPKDTTMKTAEQRQAELDAREDALKQRETEFAGRETTFSENAKKTRATEDAAFVTSIIEAGRLPIGLKESATALFSELDDGETLTFSEGDETVTKSPRAAFRDLLGKLPVPVSTKELAQGDGPDFSDPAHVQTAIETEIKAAKDRGESIDPATALNRLKARN